MFVFENVLWFTSKPSHKIACTLKISLEILLCVCQERGILAKSVASGKNIYVVLKSDL